MNRYRLVHVTEFQYDGPVSESFNEVRLRPIDDDRQSCVSFRLTTAPHTHATSHRDYFGNWVHQFNVLGEHRRLRVDAESVVLMHEAPPAHLEETLSFAEYQSRRDQVQEEFYEYLTPTPYVPHLAELQPLLAEVRLRSLGTVRGFLEAASDLVHERFRYEKGATHVNSSIHDSLTRGAGVCQDFAHLMLAIARMEGIPGRYVSGYLVPREAAEPGSLAQVIGGQASHAWTEANIPGAGWLSFDPTLGAPVSFCHVRIAYGRDYGDVAPVRGIYKGHAGQRLSVDVLVRPALDDEGHEQLQETAAGPAETPAAEERLQQPQQQQQ